MLQNSQWNTFLPTTDVRSLNPLSLPCTKRLFARTLNPQYRQLPLYLSAYSGARKCSKNCGEGLEKTLPRPRWGSSQTVAPLFLSLPKKSAYYVQNSTRRALLLQPLWASRSCFHSSYRAFPPRYCYAGGQADMPAGCDIPRLLSCFL